MVLTLSALLGFAFVAARVALAQTRFFDERRADLPRRPIGQ